MNIQWIGTSDFTAGRGGKPIQYIIIHWGVTSALSQIDAEVANPAREMSYTYALSDDTVHQYVSEDNTAWHCGVFDKNQRSIGVCINAGPNNPYTEKDYATCAQLCNEILLRHPGLKIIGHRDVKATECPGNFSFDKLSALMAGGVVEKDAVRFEGSDRVYFWAQNPTIATQWYGSDWAKWIRDIKPQIVKEYVDKPYPVEKIVEVIKEVEKVVEVEVPVEIIKEIIVQAQLTDEQKSVLSFWDKLKSIFTKG